GRINGEFGRVGVPAVHYLNQAFDRAEVAALFLAADVMAVPPLRGGMNLAAKEGVASRTDNGGALVLSEFTGAAAELGEAYLINPHDLDGMKETLVRAVNATPAENRARMRAMRRHVRSHDVRAWPSTGAAESGPDLLWRSHRATPYPAVTTHGVTPLTPRSCPAPHGGSTPMSEHLQVPYRSIPDMFLQRVASTPD